MSISLPNGTILAAPSSSHTQISAAVTRILLLQKFSSDLKTRDLQLMFKDWQNEKGGFVIKWIDDVSALVVFADASVAKRAYLSFLLSPPPTFPSPASIKPYDRPDAAQIIQTLQARSMGHRASMSSAITSSGQALVSNDPFTSSGHHRGASVSSGLSGFVMPTSSSFPGPGHGHQKSGSISRGSGFSNLNGNASSLQPLRNSTSSNSNTLPNATSTNQSQGMGQFSHTRTSSSSRPSRASLSGLFSFPPPTSLSSQTHQKLSTHVELPSPSPNQTLHFAEARRQVSRSTSGSSDGDEVVVDPGLVGLGGLGQGTGQGRFGSGKIGRRGSGNGNGNGNGNGGVTTGGRRESISADKALSAVQKALGMGVEA